MESKGRATAVQVFACPSSSRGSFQDPASDRWIVLSRPVSLPVTWSWFVFLFVSYYGLELGVWYRQRVDWESKGKCDAMKRIPMMARTECVSFEKTPCPHLE